MNSTFFECKISYLGAEEDGKVKKVSESIIVDALSFTESEARVTEEMESFDCLSIKEIKRSNYAEIIIDSTDVKELFFKCKANMLSLDEISGKEKKTSIYFLINGDSVADTLNVFNEKIVKTTMGDITLASVVETKIAQVIFTAETVEQMVNEETKETIDLVKVQCDDMYAMVDRKLLNKQKFDILFENGIKLTFTNDDKGIVCTDVEDTNSNPSDENNDTIKLLYDTYLSKELKYSYNK